MNYRHAFHAGNFADVLKHAVLARILTHLVQKPTPLRYIDTHAGIGWYDLAGDAATRTGEWASGIGRVQSDSASPKCSDLLAPYLDIVGPRDGSGRPLAYPGSPAVAQHLLRPADKLLLCEKHPEDAVALRAALKGDKRAKIVEGDGYRLLNAAVPPPERRGVVLIDPPFEDSAEFDAMADAFASAFRKWPTGVYLLWYPIKDTTLVARFERSLGDLGLPRWMRITLQQPPGSDPDRLRGSGLFIANPPHTLPSEMDLLLPYLSGCFSRGGDPWRWTIEAHLP